MLHYHVTGPVIAYMSTEKVIKAEPVLYERSTKHYDLYKAEGWKKPRYFRKDDKEERGNKKNFSYSYIDSYNYKPFKLISECAPDVKESVLAKYYRVVKSTRVYAMEGKEFVITRVKFYKQPTSIEPEIKGYCSGSYEIEKSLYSSLEYTLYRAYFDRTGNR